MGHEVFHKKVSLQRLNIKSSTKAELVGVSESLPYNLRLINFLHGHAYVTINKIAYQDNQSEIRIDNNGSNCCTGNSRQIYISHFFSSIE